MSRWRPPLAAAGMVATVAAAGALVDAAHLGPPRTGAHPVVDSTPVALPDLGPLPSYTFIPIRQQNGVADTLGRREHSKKLNGSG